MQATGPNKHQAAVRTESEILLLDMSPAQWVKFHSLCDQYQTISNDVQVNQNPHSDGEPTEWPVHTLMRAGAEVEADPLGYQGWYSVILEAQRDSEYVILRGSFTVQTTVDGWARVKGITAWAQVGTGSTLTDGVYGGLLTLWRTQSHLWVTVVAG